MSPENYSPPRGILLALLLLLGVVVPAAMGQANVKGQWTTLGIPRRSIQSTRR